MLWVSFFQHLLTLFISIGIGLGTVTALAFSTQPKIFYNVTYNVTYNATFNATSDQEPFIKTEKEQVRVRDHANCSSITSETIALIMEELSNPNATNMTIDQVTYNSTTERCFADTSIISETVREILKHISNKFFFVSIGIVTILYSITFVLALQRQNPRIQALKKSLNVLNKFDTYPSNKNHPQRHKGSSVSIPSTFAPLALSEATITPAALSEQRTTFADDFHHSDENLLGHAMRSDVAARNSRLGQHYEMSCTMPHDDSSDRNLSSPNLVQQPNDDRREHEPCISSSEGTSDDVPPSTDKLNAIKQVSFQIHGARNASQTKRNKTLSISSVSLDGDMDGRHNMHCKLVCPCSNTRQFLIKFQFGQSATHVGQWLCCRYLRKKPPVDHHHASMTSHNDDETSTILRTGVPNHPVSSSSSGSETLRRQIHQQRLKQIRMVSTFLLITVSFVLFYLPSILNAERIIKSSLQVYYLYLCTHALNPIIYCFMNPKLREHVVSMLKCGSKQPGRTSRAAKASFIDR